MASETTTIDYAAVLADLKARRAQIDAAIAGLEAANLTQAIGVTAVPLSADTSTIASTVAAGLQRDSFFNLTVPDAAKKYLSIRKRAATTAEIIDALRTGGQASATGEGFSDTVTSGLHRSYKQGSGIVRVGRGTWGLAEWYPNKPRKPPENQE